jgi:hypothetical protein
VVYANTMQCLVNNDNDECLLCNVKYTDGLCIVFTVLFSINASAMTRVDTVMFNKRIGNVVFTV